MKKSLIILASPSGGGKSTVAKHLIKTFSLSFSTSATTRPMRLGEVNGKDYYFYTRDEFLQKVADDEFIEYEEIFGNLYGTLKSEIDKALIENKKLIFDIDVLGALNIKRLYPEHALLIFLSPPNLDILEKRLRSRMTESEVEIQTRIDRAEMEMAKAKFFDHIVINDVLEDTLIQAEQIVKENS